MLCHGGSILGKSYVGLGNTTLDVQAMFEELPKVDGLSGKTPFAFSNVAAPPKPMRSASTSSASVNRT